MELEEFIRPLYQDLDGVSRFDAVERIGRIARRLHPPSRDLDLLILFSGLGKWLDKPRNRSRLLLTTDGVTESELHSLAASIRRLDEPQTDVERAVAAARLIDAAGVRGLAERLAHSRREGLSVTDVAREEPPVMPEWMSEAGRAMLEKQHEARQHFCDAILSE